MAEIPNTSAAQPPESLVSASQVLGQEDTLMPDGEAEPIAQESPTTTLSTETSQTEEPAESTHEPQTPPRRPSITDTTAAEPPTPRIGTPSAGITGGVTEEDLAMQRNPKVTADSSMVDPQPPEDLAIQRNPAVTTDSSMVDPQSAEGTVQAQQDYSQNKETDSVQDQRQETSVIGWLVSPRAEEPPTAAEQSTSTVETATEQSRISFDGACSSFTLLQLLTPQFDCIQYEIETSIQLKRVFPHLMFWDSDYLTLSEITFEWGDSYDDKDWVRLRAILAPTLTLDYTDVNGHNWDSMPAEDFVGIMSHIGFVGDPLVHTQHHIGASMWQKFSDDEVVGHHQLRAAHQKYTALDMRVVENKGYGYAMVKHFYRKIGGEWKLAGLRPTVRWDEFEFEKIFKGF